MSGVVVVDDDRVVRLVLEHQLESGGHEVRSVGRLSEVTDDLLFWADVVVCDLQLEGESGLDLYERILSSGTATPFALLTGTEDQDDLDDERGRSVDAYLTKPVATGDLLAVVERLCAGADGRGTGAEWCTPAPGTPVPAGAALDQAEAVELLDLEVLTQLAALGLDMSTQLADSLEDEFDRLEPSLSYPDQATASAHRLAGAALAIGCSALGEHLRSIEQSRACDPDPDRTRRLFVSSLAARERWLISNQPTGVH